MSRLQRKSRRMVAVTLGAVLVIGLGACGGSDDADGAMGGGAEMQQNETSDGGRTSSLSDQSSSGSSPGELGTVGQVDLTQDDSVFGSPRVIKNGQVELVVARGEFDAAVDDVYFLATRLEGIVKSTAIDDSGEGRGVVVVRIPSARFEDALTELRDIGRIESHYVDTQDVTDEFVDLESRIRNARTAEKVLLNLMDEAATIRDTIRVQNQLERVQENIERMRGRLRVLDDQTSFSTLAVDLVEEGAAPKDDKPEEAGTMARAWDDAVAGFMGVVSAVIVSSGVLLPIVLLALVVVLVVRRLLPRFDKGSATTAPATDV